MLESKQKFQSYLTDLGNQMKRDRSYKNTNELVKRIFNHKKDLNERISNRALSLFNAIDPAIRSKSGDEPTA